MNKTLTTLLLLFLTLSASAGSREKVNFDGYCIVLVTSAECGFCIKNIPWFNSLAEKYARRIQMIALYESSQKKIDKLSSMFPGREVTLRKWETVPNARKIYLPLIDRETFPQIILLKNGKAVKHFIGTIQSVKEAVEKEIPLFIKEKETGQ